MRRSLVVSHSCQWSVLQFACIFILFYRQHPAPHPHRRNYRRNPEVLPLGSFQRERIIQLGEALVVAAGYNSPTVRRGNKRSSIMKTVDKIQLKRTASRNVRIVIRDPFAGAHSHCNTENVSGQSCSTAGSTRCS